MVEVTSMNREAAARAAAILKKHHRYVQYGQLEANLEDDTWAETITADIQSSEEEVDEEELEVTHVYDHRHPSTPSIASSKRVVRAGHATQSPSSRQSKTPKPPGSFPAGEQPTIATASTLALNIDRTIEKMQVHHDTCVCTTHNVFGDAAWTCLEVVLLAEVVARANAMRSRTVISKSESLLAASRELDMVSLIRFFLHTHDLSDDDISDASTQWSLDATIRRGHILRKRFVEDLKQRYPHLSGEQLQGSAAPSCLANEITPSLSRQTLPDESHDDTAQHPVPFRHVVASTPGPKMLQSNGITQSLFPELPRPASQVEFDSGDESRADASNLSRFVRGLGKLASFLRLGESEESRGVKVHRNTIGDDEDTQQDIQMREANLQSQPVTVSRRPYTTHPGNSDSIVASHAALVDQRVAYESVPARQMSFATGKRWRAPFQENTASTTGLATTSTSVVSPTPARRIATGSSSYVRPTAISMLSPATHAIAREKVETFRDSRQERHWRTPHRPRAPRNPGVRDVSRLSSGMRTHSAHSTFSSSYNR
jgi:hypothetical protein